MEYTTLDNLKQHLWITDTSQDTFLSRIITRITAIFDAYLWRNLWITTYEEYYDLEDDLIITTFWPIRTIQELKDENNNPISYKRINWNLIFLEEEINWTIYIKYTAWYNDLSEIQDVEQACLEACKNVYNQAKNQWQVKSKSIEWLSISYFSSQELSWWWMQEILNYQKILDKYKAFKPLIV